MQDRRTSDPFPAGPETGPSPAEQPGAARPAVDEPLDQRLRQTEEVVRAQRRRLRDLMRVTRERGAAASARADRATARLLRARGHPDPEPPVPPHPPDWLDAPER